MLRVSRAIAVATIVLATGVFADSGAAAEAAAFKAEIDGYLHRVSNGLLSWDGADAIDVSDDGDAAVAVITKAHLSLHKSPGAPELLTSITLDRIEIRRKPAGKLVEYDIALPSHATAVGADGTEVNLSLDEGKAMAVVEGDHQQTRELSLDMTRGRIEVGGKPGNGRFGSVSGHWKLTADDKGGWTAPVSFEVKGIAFQIPEANLAGSIDRVAYDGNAAGTSVAELDAFRDLLAQAREEVQRNADHAAADYLDAIAKMFSVFTGSQAELSVEGVSTQRLGGEPLVTLTKAAFGGKSETVGADGVSLRMFLRHEGLSIASSLLPAAQVPRRAVIDFGLENIAVSVLRQIAAAAKLGPDATDADRRAAMAQMFAAALRLQPTLRIYDAAVDFRDARIDATGEAKRAPPPPFGYAADGNVTVHGFDALDRIAPSLKARMYLMLLKFLGETATGADGDAVTQFHLASKPGKPITVNGNDIALWFGAGESPPGAERVLRLVDPPLTGDDVRAVQKKLVMPDGRTDGVYDGMTALAVMRFQKEHALNINGVVDAATREKLGIASPSPAPKN